MQVTGSDLDHQSATLYANAHCFGTRCGIELSQNGADVELDRVSQDPESPRNLFVREPFGHESQHLLLASGELF